MTVIYDAGVLVAADRNDRRVWAEHRARLELGTVPGTTAPVIAQVSRSARQTQLRRFLRGCGIASFDAEQAHEVGSLLAATATNDVVDAHVIVIASHVGATVLTSDPGDLARLAGHVAASVAVHPV